MCVSGCAWGIYVSGATLNANWSVANGCANGGMAAQNNADGFFEYGIAVGNSTAGVYAYICGSMQVQGITACDNAAYGLLAQYGSEIFALSSNIQGNGGYYASASYSSTVVVSSSTIGTTTTNGNGNVAYPAANATNAANSNNYFGFVQD